MTDFSIRILEQGWLESDDYDSEVYDICRHGNIELIINDQSLLENENKGSWGVSNAAMRLMREIYFLKEDSSFNQNYSEIFDSPLIGHGCAFPPFLECPYGWNWELAYQEEDEKAILSDFRFCKLSNVFKKNLTVVLPMREYAQRIYFFAKEAFDFYTSVEKKFADEYEKREYNEFVEEYRLLLDLFEATFVKYTIHIDEFFAHSTEQTRKPTELVKAIEERNKKGNTHSSETD